MENTLSIYVESVPEHRDVPDGLCLNGTNTKKNSPSQATFTVPTVCTPPGSTGFHLGSRRNSFVKRRKNEQRITAPLPVLHKKGSARFLPLYQTIKNENVMQDNKQNTPAGEEADRNKQEQHNPVQAGKEAVEASKLNDKGKPVEQQRADEAKDAERWRNEG